MEWMIQGLEKLGEIKPDALKKVFKDIEEQRPEIFRSLVLIAYVDNKISLSKAAELLGLSRLELQRELLKAGIPIRSLSEEDTAAEVEMLRKCC